jgi:transposase
MAPPKKYPDELRSQAVQRWREAQPRPPIIHLARELGVHREALRGWIRQDEVERGERAESRGYRVADDDELKRLRLENAELRRINEILTAASALFVSELNRERRDLGASL